MTQNKDFEEQLLKQGYSEEHARNVASELPAPEAVAAAASESSPEN